MEEDNIKIDLNMNEVFDLLPESYTKLPLAAITDKYFGYRARNQNLTTKKGE